MKAVVLDVKGARLDAAYPRPTPERDEALIKTRYAGICDTDVALAAGYLSFAGVPGHEFVGVVEAGPSAWLGKRVVGEINCPCGVCERCLAGEGNHCAFRTVLGISGRPGVLAEYFLLPGANLHEVPDAVPDEAAVFTEILAAAVNIIDRVHVPSSARVAVLGDGKLGLMAAQVINLTGAAVTVIGRHAERQATLAAMGRPVPLISPGEAPPAHYDVLVEATGAADGLSYALRYVRPRGTVVLKTTAADVAAVDLAPAVVNEITVVGNRCGPFGPALALLAEKLIDPRPLIEEVHPLEDAPGLISRGAPGLKHLIRF